MADNKLKIIFVGMPDMALVALSDLLKNEFNIVGVIPPKKDHETYNYFVDFCTYRNLSILEYDGSCNDTNLIEKIKELNADIGVVCSFNYKLSKEFLNSTKMGYINCHPSLLPQYRGAAPYFHIVNNGEKKSGITLHFMDENFDTGDIIYQKEFEVLPFETMGTIFNRTNFMLSEALIEILTKIQNGEKIKKIPQDKNNKFNYAPKVDGNFRIRWNTNTAIEIERLVRASNPFFNVFTFYRGVNVKVIKARALNKNHNLKPGQIAQADNRNLIVAAKNDLVSLDVVQVGTWGVFEPMDFYYTFSPKTNEFFI